MSDKHLSGPEWKKFAKGRELKDASLLKALAAFESAKDAEARLAALDEIDKQAELLHKAAGKADKELSAYLDETRKAAAKEHKLAQAEAEAGEDEEEDSPALLTTALPPLLRQVRKGVAMKAMVAVAAKDTAVLLAKRSIAPARRKLLQEYLGGGAAKYALGECIWEENAHTFVLQTAAAGLAKKIRAALLAQTGMRVKVRVRGESPDDIDDDGEAPEHEEAEGDAPAAAHDAHEAHDADAAAFNARLAALMPRIKDALTAAGPNAAALKLKVGDAGAAARNKDFARAGALLDEAEKLAANGGAATAAALADWHARRDNSVVSLKAVAGKVAAAKHASSAKAILELQAVITRLSTVPSTPQQAGELQQWLKTDGIVDDLCELAEDIRTPLLASLERLRVQLAA